MEKTVKNKNNTYKYTLSGKINLLSGKRKIREISECRFCGHPDLVQGDFFSYIFITFSTLMNKYKSGYFSFVKLFDL